MTGDSSPHSAAWFGDQRDFWWNRDFLELIASRLDLASVRTVLDVGAGLGHWGQLLASVLSPEARVTGVEREPRWVEEATRRADIAGLADRFEYVEGVAESLPFPDESFDLVTCQTVLIHLADPRAGIREMLRVAKPGGLVLAAEPNNRGSVVVDSSASADDSAEELLERLEFVIRCERGKEALGEGNGSVGDLVPGYLAQEGAIEIRTWTSDKTSAMVPPYEGAEQQTLRDDYLNDAGKGWAGWSRDEARRYFLAGGGDQPQFDAAWERRLQETLRDAEAVREGKFHSAGGYLMYVIAARRAK
jgi:SAM-dependent methyltransferase